MLVRRESKPHDLNQDVACSRFRCCLLLYICTAPLPHATEISSQMKTSTKSIDLLVLQANYTNLHHDNDRV